MGAGQRPVTVVRHRGDAPSWATSEAPSTFTSPTDVRPLVAALTGFTVTQTNVPATGLDTEQVKQAVAELAVTFFGTILKRVGNDGPHFTRYVAPKRLVKHQPMVGTAEAVASADAICPPGQQLVCV